MSFSISVRSQAPKWPTDRDRPWRYPSMALYMVADGRNTVRPAARSRDGFNGRSDGVDMDALIKPLRGNKPSDTRPSEFRPAELDPAEFLAAAVRADQPRPSRAEAERAVQTLLGYIGENPSREGLLDTPRRVVEAFDELYQGYHQCPAEVLDRTFGETAGYDDFVLIRDIEFTSQCEHHMMPF